jgi:hypothetical protein
MTIKIEFPSGDKLAAKAFGDALHRYAGEVPAAVSGHVEATPKPADHIDHVEPTPRQADHVEPTPRQADHVEPKGEDHVEGAPTVFGGSDASKVDHKGVAFNDAYCANAADPFYGSGKRSGQWKKKRGVDDATYDGWYASQLDAGAPAAETETQLDTAAAFGAAPATETAAAPAPATAGELLKWVSEQQAGGHLTADDISQAYTSAGLTVADLFPVTPPDQIAQNVAVLYGLLSGAGA